MLQLQLIPLLITVTAGLKAVPLGEIRSAETLSSSPSLSTSPAPLSTLTNTDLFLHNDTKQARSPSETLIDGDETETQSPIDDHAVPNHGFDMDTHFHNKDGDDWGLYVPIELKGETTVVRRSVWLEKRAQYCGIVHMDCRKAPEVCMNAGYYQNCMRKAKGNYQSFTYTNGPLEDDENIGTPQANENRYNSGVTTSWSRPCRAWLFAQKFWHPQDPKGLGPVLDLRTDEWPMAIMKTGIVGQMVSVSLRCMTAAANSAGGREVTDFRRPTGPNYLPGGRWAGESRSLSRKQAFGARRYVLRDVRLQLLPEKGRCGLSKMGQCSKVSTHSFRLHNQGH
jgi:hypothetical protein